MMNKIISYAELKGTLLIPPSKSDAQRALLAASLCTGASKISNVGESDDVQAMLSIVNGLGADVEKIGTDYIISGPIELKDGSVIDCNESGLAARLMIAQSILSNGSQTITGSGSILNRSQKFILDDLVDWDVDYSCTNNTLPIIVKGKIRKNQLTANGAESSQFISGMLMAIPLHEDFVRLTVLNATSIPYTLMTLNTLERFGIHYEMANGVYALTESREYIANDYAVEGDWSAASFWIVASALGHQITIQGLNSISLQADTMILDAIRQSGCEINWTTNELVVSSTRLKPFSIDCSNAPDLFPALVALAVYCDGQSKIDGVHRLANKESDRAVALMIEFGKLGAEIRIEGNSMLIVGGKRLKGSKVSSHNDHRIAMSLAIASTRINGIVEIDQAEAVAKSYPTFWNHFDQLNEGAH